MVVVLFRMSLSLVGTFVALLLSSALAGSCTDVASCEVRSSSLMQQKVSVVHESARLKIEQGYLQTSLVKVRALASNVTEWGTNLTQAERNALDIIKEFIEKLFSSANRTHGEDQREVYRVKDLIIGCANDTKNSLEHDVQPLKISMQDHRKNHDECRVSEANYTVNKSAKCAEWDSFRKNNTPTSCSDIKFNESTLGTDEMDSRSGMEQCLRDLQPFYLKHLPCWTFSQLLDQQAPSCDSDQTDFEESFCDYTEKLNGTCGQQSRCREVHIEVRSDTHSDVQINEVARKADWATGKHVLCYFSVFKANNSQKNATLHKCDQLAVNTSHLSIFYPEIPASENCTVEEHEPCETAWLQDEYDTKVWADNVSRITCTPCIPPSTPGALPVPVWASVSGWQYHEPVNLGQQYRVSGSFSMCAKVRAKHGTGGGGRILSKRSAEKGWEFIAPRPNSGVVSFYSGIAVNKEVVPRRIDDGRWHHVAVTYNETDKKMRGFVDGLLKRETTITVHHEDNADLWVGAREGTYQVLVGNLTDVKLFDEQLSEQQIRILAGLVGDVVNPPENMRTYSSTHPDCSSSMINSSSSWCSGVSPYAGQWVQMQLDTVMDVTGVVTQGRHGGSQWVTKFRVEFSLDGDAWSSTAPSVFWNEGKENDYIDRHSFSEVKAKFIRLIVEEHKGYASMRAGVVVAHSVA